MNEKTLNILKDVIKVLNERQYSIVDIRRMNDYITIEYFRHEDECYELSISENDVCLYRVEQVKYDFINENNSLEVLNSIIK